MSALDPPRLPPRVTPLPAPLRLVQVAAFRDSEAALAARLQASGWQLPAFGRAWFSGERSVCCVRPRRWLLIEEAGPATAADTAFGPACVAAVGEAGAVTELGAARCAWRITDPTAREWLAAGCRLDLQAQVFTPGSAAVTLLAQVPVMLVAEPAAWLLYGPSSMHDHLAHWLGNAARSARPHPGSPS